ncbi:MAG: hypothetical protein V1692_01325 [bacterium]
MSFNKKIASFLTISFLTLILPLLTMAAGNNVYSENKKNIGYFSSIFGEPKDPRYIAGGIIEAFLGFLGILFISYMIYGGYTWMTAGGNDDKVSRAKDVIRNAIIGIAVLLAAWGITNFVINALTGTNI